MVKKNKSRQVDLFTTQWTLRLQKRKKQCKRIMRKKTTAQFQHPRVKSDWEKWKANPCHILHNQTSKVRFHWIVDGDRKNHVHSWRPPNGTNKITAEAKQTGTNGGGESSRYSFVLSFQAFERVCGWSSVNIFFNNRDRKTVIYPWKTERFKS